MNAIRTLTGAEITTVRRMAKDGANKIEIRRDGETAKQYVERRKAERGRGC